VGEPVRKVGGRHVAASVHRVPAPAGRTREEDILLEIQPIVRANADDAKAAFREKGDDLTPSCRVGVQVQAPTGGS